MAEKEHDVSLDDLEIEFSDLDQPGGSHGPTAPRGPRFTPRQRKLSMVFTVTLFIVIASLFLGSIAEVRGLLARTLFPPRPTAISNNLAFYIRGNPSWGQFTLDGKPLTHLPVIGREAPLLLPPGLHQITWHAAPFNAQSCTLNVVSPAEINGSCLRHTKIVPDIQTLVISFFASLADLPPDQHIALVQQIQAALATLGGSATVQPGELYTMSAQQVSTNSLACKRSPADGTCAVRAQQPLLATLGLQLNTSTDIDDPCETPGVCFFNGQDCRLLCESPLSDHHSLARTGWNVRVPVRPIWSYATLAGETIARNQPNSTGLFIDRGYQPLSLHIEQAGQRWQIEPFYDSAADADFDGPLCSQATGDILLLLSIFSGKNRAVSVQQAADLQHNMAAGCLIVVTSAPLVIRDPRTPGPNTPPAAYFLARFGVEVAANTAARQLLPNLPVADAYEMALAERLSADLPSSA